MAECAGRPRAFLHFTARCSRGRAGRPVSARSSVWFWLVVVRTWRRCTSWRGCYQTGHMPEQSLHGFRIGGGRCSASSRWSSATAARRASTGIPRAVSECSGSRWPSRSCAGGVLEAGGSRAIARHAMLQFRSMRVAACRWWDRTAAHALRCSPTSMARDPVFDPRRILERSIPYALLSGVLAAIYLGLVLVGQNLFSVLTGEEAMAFNVVAALVAGRSPSRRCASASQRWLDRLFRRDPRALRAALDQAGRELLGRARPRRGARLGRSRASPAVSGAAVAIDWPEVGGPSVAPGEELSEDARAVENLLVQAGIRLENLALQEQRADCGAPRHRAARDGDARRAARAARPGAAALPVQRAERALLSHRDRSHGGAALHRAARRHAALHRARPSDRPAVLLSDEIAFVEDYLGVARERYEDDAGASTTTGARELLSAAVPPLLLQPLVENSLKHGCVGQQACAQADGSPAAIERRLADARVRRRRLQRATSTERAGWASGSRTSSSACGASAASEAAHEPRAERAHGGFRVVIRWRDSKGGAAMGAAWHYVEPDVKTARCGSLIADDEPRARQFLERLLGEHGRHRGGRARRSGGVEALLADRTSSSPTWRSSTSTCPISPGLEVARHLGGDGLAGGGVRHRLRPPRGRSVRARGARLRA